MAQITLPQCVVKPGADYSLPGSTSRVQTRSFSARNNHQEQSETIQDTNGIRATNNITAQPNSTDEQPISETNISLEDEELGSPPTYAEALSCEVVRGDVQALRYGHSRIENFSYSPPRRPKQWHPYKNGQTVANKDSSIQETAAITYVTTSDIGDAM